MGLSARLVFPDTSVFDAELALPMMAVQLLPEVLVGLILAGVVAASVSTADSQILGCSAALTEDVIGKQDSSIELRRIATAVVTAIALGISLFAVSSVFTLVLYAWSVLAAAFAPLIIIYALGEKLRESTALILMLGCTVVALGWRALGLDTLMYDVGPAMVFGLGLYFFVIKPLQRRSIKST